ncbi:sugar phosphate isomerase/epimerase family protein [Neobacillus sp. NRS-1170]|uniref:sugar phosphate isomerase/epimerase family protein n=1 Tax=Neobacillus sp. NRS-1170 TaxID=3233898 RepID=UPI003D2B32E4
MKTAEQLNGIGKQCKGAGLDCYYHNHVHEFKRIGESTLFDLLIENTDPEFVKFELDLIWVMRAGYDPLSVLEKLGNRCDMIHQKDLGTHVDPVNISAALKENYKEDTMKLYREIVKSNDFVNLGTGIVNFEETYKKLNLLGSVRFAIVENEGQQGNKFTNIASDLKVMEQYIQ